MKSKSKGALAEAAVTADLLRRGYHVALPFGGNWPYDLIVSRDNGRTLERVEVKYARSNEEEVLIVRARTHSLTRGRVIATRVYSAEDVDWLAVYDATTEQCYYLPANDLTSVHGQLSLRLVPTRNGQQKLIRMADSYREI